MSPRPILGFKKLRGDALTPKKSTYRSVGFDLRSPIDAIIRKNDKSLIELQLQFEFPHGSYGRIASRSGLALTNSIVAAAGVIDPDYKGNVGVLLFNFGEEDYHVKRGVRVAQLIVECALYPQLKDRTYIFIASDTDEMSDQEPSQTDEADREIDNIITNITKGIVDAKGKITNGEIPSKKVAILKRSCDTSDVPTKRGTGGYGSTGK